MRIPPTPFDRIINLGIAFAATIAIIGVAATIANMAIWAYNAIMG
jgi:hypothetical protein